MHANRGQRRSWRKSIKDICSRCISTVDIPHTSVGSSGARTNLKIAGQFCLSCPSLFGSTSANSRFGECFGNGQSGQFLVGCSTHRVTVSPCPMESAPLIGRHDEVYNLMLLSSRWRPQPPYTGWPKK